MDPMDSDAFRDELARLRGMTDQAVSMIEAVMVPFLKDYQTMLEKHGLREAVVDHMVIAMYERTRGDAV